MLTPNIDKLLGLHQEVSIIYIVDGYKAIFYSNENWDRLAEAEGKTVIEALMNLEIELGKCHLKRTVKITY